MNKPFFSIVYPTRNRPFFLKYCLKALKLQTFYNFEVVVCDNFTTQSAKEVFREYENDNRFKYVTTPEDLAMYDNWEYASSFTKGQYVAVLTDKMVLIPTALQKVFDVLKDKPAEVITWREEFFIPDTNELETTEYDSGIMPLKFSCKEKPFYYDGYDYLKKRFSFGFRRGTVTEGASYYWGKICFGFYKRSLIDRIITKTGRLFWKYSPDYTSMVSALTLSNASIDMGEVLHVVFSVKISNGQQNSTNFKYLLETCKSIDSELKIFKELPFTDLCFSQHNHVALDYMIIKNKLQDEMSEFELNRMNLFIRVLEDFTYYSWDDRLLVKSYLMICLKEWLNFSHQEKVIIVVKLLMFYIKKIIINVKRRISHIILSGFLTVLFKNLFHLSKPGKYPNIIDAAKSI